MYETFIMVLHGMFQFGVAIGVGATTVLLTLWLISQADGVITEDEDRPLRMVDRILRGALAIIAFALVVSFVSHAVIRDLQYALQFAFCGVLGMNMILMEYHKAPRYLGPALQGATWYALFLVTVLPVGTLPTVVTGVIYLAWVIVVYLIIRVIVNAIHDRAGN